MVRKSLLVLFFCAALAGCDLPASTTAPTPYPTGYIPTVIYLTASSLNATKAAAVTQTPTLSPTPDILPATALPTLTPTPGPAIPLAAIQINKPGPMSRVASPLELTVIAYPGKSNRVQIDLYGEDGRLLSRTIQYTLPQPLGAYMFVKIPFEIRAAAELGMIQVSTKNEAGLIQSLSSVQVLLISSGDSQINPPGNNIYEHVTIESPLDNTTVSGGVVTVRGEFLPINKQPVILELVSNDGKSLGLRVLNFNGLDPQSFTTTIPYKIEAETQARLFIHQADNVINGPIYVYSQLITLDP